MKQSPLDVSRTPLARVIRWRAPLRIRIIVGLIVTLGIWGWFDVRVRGTVDPDNPLIHKTDFTVYTEAGAAFFDGRDPYEVSNPRGWKYLYPPLFAILVAPLHALPPQAQVLVWFAVSVLAGWGCYVECVRIGRAVLPHEPDRGPFGPIPTWIGYAGITAAMLPALNCLQRGQVGVAKLYLLLLGFRLLVESRSTVRSFVAGCVLAAAIVLKVTPLVPAAFVLFQQGLAAWWVGARREVLPRIGACWLGTAVGLATCLLLVPAAFVGWRANLHHVETWWNTVAVRMETTTADDFAGDSYSVRNQSLTNATHRFGNWAHYCFAGGLDDAGPERLAEGGPGLLMDAPLVDDVLLAARFLAGCLLLAVGYRTARAGALARTAGFGLACVATLVIIPVARAHYFVLLLPAVVFLSLWLVEQRRPRLAVVYAVVPGVLVFVHYVLLDVAGRIGVLGLGTTLWYAAACVAMLRIGPSACVQNRSGSSPSVPSQLRAAATRPLAA